MGGILIFLRLRFTPGSILNSGSIPWLVIPLLTLV
jgi:hypothetical protein